MGKIHENVLLAANFDENLKLLSKASLRVNSDCTTFFKDYTDWFPIKIKNCKI